MYHRAYIRDSKVKKNHANYPAVTEFTCKWSVNICRTAAGNKHLDGTRQPLCLSHVCYCGKQLKQNGRFHKGDKADKLSNSLMMKYM